MMKYTQHRHQDSKLMRNLAQLLAKNRLLDKSNYLAEPVITLRLRNLRVKNTRINKMFNRKTIRTENERKLEP